MQIFIAYYIMSYDKQINEYTFVNYQKEDNILILTDKLLFFNKNNKTALDILLNYSSETTAFIYDVDADYCAYAKQLLGYFYGKKGVTAAIAAAKILMKSSTNYTFYMNLASVITSII